MSFLLDGKELEKQFARLISTDEFATESEDINEHWDIKYSVKIDVKGLKKLNRYHDFITQEWHWIELKNVHGKLGWLYGDADYFAFELINYWVIVSKEKLQGFIKTHVKKEIVNDKIPYKLYRREGRKDTITIISSFDLMYLAEKIIPKEKFHYFDDKKF